MRLEVKGLTLDYQMRRTGSSLRAIEDLSFAVPARAFTAIVGPSGCGKTTLLKIIAGLTEPTAGSVTLDGSPLGRAGEGRAMVFQSPALLPWRSVIRNVTYGLEIQGMAFNQARQRALKYLEWTGLLGFEESYPNELSLGMQQRVNLARAMATEPRLLLLDEPFASLDAQTRLYMQLELQEVWERTGSTALFVTHQITEAILLADWVVVLTGRPGRVREILPVELPRPRTRKDKRTAAFTGLEEHIWQLVGEESDAMRDRARADR